VFGANCALTNAPSACLGAPDYESGGQEFESLRARQYLVTTYRAKNISLLRVLQGSERAGHPRQSDTLVPFQILHCEGASLDASATCQSRGPGFEPFRPLQFFKPLACYRTIRKTVVVARWSLARRAMRRP
jgi:hypothetical protein